MALVGQSNRELFVFTTYLMSLEILRTFSTAHTGSAILWRLVGSEKEIYRMVMQVMHITVPRFLRYHQQYDSTDQATDIPKGKDRNEHYSGD